MPPVTYGYSFTAVAPARHTAWISVAVWAPGSPATPAARHQSTTSTDATGVTISWAPAPAAASASSTSRIGARPDQHLRR